MRTRDIAPCTSRSHHPTVAADFIRADPKYHMLHALPTRRPAVAADSIRADPKCHTLHASPTRRQALTVPRVTRTRA